MRIRSQRSSHDEAVVIRRAAAADPALSVTALGILTRVLASAEDGVTFEALTVGERPGAVQDGLEQLRAAGYLVVDAEQVYRVSDTPQLPPGTVIAALTGASRPRPVLTPVPDLPEQDLLPPVRQLPADYDSGPERPPDREETARIAHHGASRVREALAQTREQHEHQRQEDRERRDAARALRAEAEHAAHDQELTAVRARADRSGVDAPAGSSKPALTRGR